ncbi:hypothetical protein CE91St49_10530 [Emergencia timonensis]|nr:hypothetical protein CE91St48_10550 [Emergencia timonensis]BDF11706.1 hypothetical protein CE91St49_10530 [Emergencia timonensis]
MPLKSVRFFSRTQVGRRNSKMKADWFTIIKKSASNGSTNENEGAHKCFHAFAVSFVTGSQKSVIY